MDRKLLDLLKITSALAKAARVESDIDAEAVNEIENLWIAAQEVDSEGRRTRAASEALRKLSHPKGLSTPLTRAVPASQKKSLASLSKAQASAEKALSDMVVAIIHHAEFEALRDAQPLLTNRKGEVSSSSKDEDVLWFIDWLKQHDVPPYILRRMPEWMKELLAKLMLDARDTKFEATENLWPRLFRAGVLGARGITPTPDEQRLLAEAADFREFPDDTVRRRLEQRLGRTLDVSIEFAAAIEAIVRERDTLSPYEEELLYCASKEQVSAEAKMIATILGEGDDKLPSIEAARRSIISTGEVASQVEGNEFAKTVSIVVQAIRECDKRDFDGRHWPEAIAATCQNAFTRYRPLDTSDTGFWSLMAVSLELSGLSVKYENAKGFAFQDMFGLVSQPGLGSERSDVLTDAVTIPSSLTRGSSYGPSEDAASSDSPEGSPTGSSVVVYTPPQSAPPPPRRSARRYTQEDLA